MAPSFFYFKTGHPLPTRFLQGFAGFLISCCLRFCCQIYLIQRSYHIFDPQFFMLRTSNGEGDEDNCVVTIRHIHLENIIRDSILLSPQRDPKDSCYTETANINYPGIRLNNC
jgi:hypothetical protein